MDNPRFWYDKAMMDASRIMCVLASDFNLLVIKEAQ